VRLLLRAHESADGECAPLADMHFVPLVSCMDGKRVGPRSGLDWKKGPGNAQLGSYVLTYGTLVPSGTIARFFRTTSTVLPLLHPSRRRVPASDRPAAPGFPARSPMLPRK
jgi:hypothetical protein